MLISESVCRVIILCSLNVYCASTRYIVQGAGDSAVTKTHSVSVLMKPSTPAPVAPLEIEPASPLEQPLPKLCTLSLLGNAIGYLRGLRLVGWTMYTLGKEEESHHRRYSLLWVTNVSISAPCIIH